MSLARFRKTISQKKAKRKEDIKEATGAQNYSKLEHSTSRHDNKSEKSKFAKLLK
jgi:hypothetical protein